MRKQGEREREKRSFEERRKVNGVMPKHVFSSACFG